MVSPLVQELLDVYSVRLCESVALQKTARVAKAVKMYRRALMALRSKENVFHGTKPGRSVGIAETGVVDAKPGGHGVGAYFWKRKPRASYMRYPGYEGLWTKRSKVKFGPTPKDPQPQGFQADRPFMEISSTPVKLAPGKDTTISATPENLLKAKKYIRARKFRQMDTRVFHRAEADRMMSKLDKIHGTEQTIRPTKQELVRLLQGKTKMQQVGMTRRTPTKREELNNMYGTYDEAVGRSPLMKDTLPSALQRKRGASPYDYF